MMKTLEGYGMRVMVSSWPFSVTNSTSFDAIGSQGLAVTTQNSEVPVAWDDSSCYGADAHRVPKYRGAPCYLYDPTQQLARKFHWSRLRA